MKSYFKECQNLSVIIALATFICLKNASYSVTFKWEGMRMKSHFKELPKSLCHNCIGYFHLYFYGQNQSLVLSD